MKKFSEANSKSKFIPISVRPITQKKVLQTKFVFGLAKKNIPQADHIRVVSERVREFFNQTSISGKQIKSKYRPIVVDVEKIKNAPITVDFIKNIRSSKK